MSASAERKKKKEGFLARQAKAKNFDPISEEELLRKDDVAPDDVLRLNKIAESRFTMGLLFLWQWPFLYSTIRRGWRLYTGLSPPVKYWCTSGLPGAVYDV